MFYLPRNKESKTAEASFSTIMKKLKSLNEDMKILHNSIDDLTQGQREHEEHTDRAYSDTQERINFMREKHELETKIINLQEVASRSADEEQLIKAKKDLKRTKALLKDAQSQIEKSKTETSNKVVLRQLKNQVGLARRTFLLGFEKASLVPV